MHVDCRRLVDLLHDFVTGELPADQLSTLQEHIEKCPPCGIYVSTYRLTITMSRSLPPAAIPSETAERLMDVLKRECRDA